MASIPPPLPPSSSSKLLCYYGSEISEGCQDCKLVWYVLEPPEGERDCSYARRLPEFKLLPCDATRATVSIGSKIYCLLGVSRRLLWLDTNHLEVGWTEIPTRMKKSRIKPITAVADGKIYFMDGGIGVDPWGEVFDPSNETWDTIPLPCPDFSKIARVPYFAVPLDLDVGSIGFSRKVLVLGSNSDIWPSKFYVYDVKDKRWIDPPPESSLNFFQYSSQFTEILSQPLVVGKTVYWFTACQTFYAYDLELQQCSKASLGKYTRDYCNPNAVIIHLGGGERFCLLSAIGSYLYLLKFSLSERGCQYIDRLDPYHKLDFNELEPSDQLYYSTRDVEISIEGEWRLTHAPIMLLGGMTFDGKLPTDLFHEKLGPIVTHLQPSVEDEYTLPPKPTPILGEEFTILPEPAPAPARPSLRAVGFLVPFRVVHWWWLCGGCMLCGCQGSGASCLPKLLSFFIWLPAKADSLL